MILGIPEETEGSRDAGHICEQWLLWFLTLQRSWQSPSRQQGSGGVVVSDVPADASSGAGELRQSKPEDRKPLLLRNVMPFGLKRLGQTPYLFIVFILLFFKDDITTAVTRKGFKALLHVFKGVLEPNSSELVTPVRHNNLPWSPDHPPTCLCASVIPTGIVNAAKCC